jgi:SAM-dependent methyltransferase
MSSFREALAVVRRTFRQAPLSTRAHCLVRFLTCPMPRMLDFLPPGARLLDLGAGHGTFGRLAVESGAAAAVVAVEPDARKVFATYRDPRVRFVVGYGDAVGGTFDAVTVLDVLYRLPFSAWDGFLGLAFDRLAPGGLLLLKEHDPERRVRAAWNRVQEKLVDLVGMTLGDAFSYETREQMRARLLRLGFERCAAVDLAAGPYAHVLYVARRPDGPGSPGER